MDGRAWKGAQLLHTLKLHSRFDEVLKYAIAMCFITFSESTLHVYLFVPSSIRRNLLHLIWFTSVKQENAKKKVGKRRKKSAMETWKSAFRFHWIIFACTLSTGAFHYNYLQHSISYHCSSDKITSVGGEEVCERLRLFA